MKKILYLSLFALVVMFVASCGNQPKSNPPSFDVEDSIVEEVADTTLYGVCGDATSMHMLSLVTYQGDTITLQMDLDEKSTVVGGMLVGDHLAVIKNLSDDGEPIASKVINLTSLLGRWISIDKNFNILEGGVVHSNIEAEKHPWTTWKILNGMLLLNTDTFNINELGADSLYLENNEGIYVFQRVRSNE